MTEEEDTKVLSIKCHEWTENGKRRISINDNWYLGSR